jgi:hypothetical protein
VEIKGLPRNLLFLGEDDLGVTLAEIGGPLAVHKVSTPALRKVRGPPKYPE